MVVCPQVYLGSYLDRGCVFFPEFEQFFVSLFDLLVDRLVFNFQLLEVDEV